MEAEWGPVRAAYLESHPECPVTGDMTSEVHEILAGSRRDAAYKEKACWLAMSREGHEYLQGMPFAFQLAFKLRYDPDNFDLEAFNAIYSPNGVGITLADVVSHLEVDRFDP